MDRREASASTGKGKFILTAAGAIWLRARAAPVRQPAPAGPAPSYPRPADRRYCAKASKGKRPSGSNSALIRASSRRPASRRIVQRRRVAACRFGRRHGREQHLLHSRPACRRAPAADAPGLTVAGACGRSASSRVTTGPGAAHGAGGGVRPRAQLEQRRHQPLQRGRAQRPFVAKRPQGFLHPVGQHHVGRQDPGLRAASRRPGAAGAASHSASVMAPGRPSNCRRPACASTASGTRASPPARVFPARRARPLRFAGSTRRQGPTAVPSAPSSARATPYSAHSARAWARSPRARRASQPRGPSAPASPRSRTAPGTTASGAG